MKTTYSHVLAERLIVDTPLGRACLVAADEILMDSSSRVFVWPHEIYDPVIDALIGCFTVAELEVAVAFYIDSRISRACRVPNVLPVCLAAARKAMEVEIVVLSC